MEAANGINSAMLSSQTLYHDRSLEQVTSPQAEAELSPSQFEHGRGGGG
jgi:hypothetical protein